MYGGEQQDEQDENTGANDTGPDNEDSKTAISELCLLEPDNKLWVPMTITGALGPQTMFCLARLLLLEVVFRHADACATIITAAHHCVPLLLTMLREAFASCINTC